MSEDGTVLCPRCGEHRYTPYARGWEPGMPGRPALSRLDNKTYICTWCGQDEAIRDFTSAAPIPSEEWPVTEFGA